VTGAPSVAINLGPVEWPANLSPVHFIKLELHDAVGKLLSDNFYWRGLPEQPDSLQDLAKLPTITLDAKVERHDSDGKSLVSVTLHNPGTTVAVMAHLQLRRQKSGERVLPVYYSDNYVSLVPNETKTITIEAAQSDLKGEAALVVVDGWNVGVTPVSSPEVGIMLNTNAQIDHWPTTGLPMVGSFHQ
jgi:hypothetical protein